MAIAASGFFTPRTTPPSLGRRSLPRRNPSKSRGMAMAMSARVGQRPLEEIYNVRVERRVSPQRLTELGVDRWSTWKTGTCRLPWDWHVDQQVYIVAGEVTVVPDGNGNSNGGGEAYMRFGAGDLVRYPKWFEADLYFHGPYEERYRFRAYGDD